MHILPLLTMAEDNTEHYVRECYSGINQDVTELFVSLCTLQSQRSVTSYMKKPVIKPIAADSFLRHVEIDLTNFRKLPCTCTPVTDFPNPNKRKHDENDTQRKKLKTDINERQLNYGITAK